MVRTLQSIGSVVATVKNRHLVAPPQSFTRHGQTNKTGTTQEQDSHSKPPELTPAQDARIQISQRAFKALSGLGALFRQHVLSQPIWLHITWLPK
jgi:hypothetical protein